MLLRAPIGALLASVFLLAPSAEAVSIVSMVTVARSGQAAPGTAAGVVFSTFAQTVLAENGEVVVRGTLSGPGVTTQNRDVVYRAAPNGPLTLAARTQTSPVGTGFILIHSSTTDGQVVFGNLQTKYRTTPSGTVVAVRSTDPAPDLPAGVIVGDSQITTVNDAGGVAFGSTLQGTGVNTSNDRALFAPGVSGATTLLAREGSPAPGVPAGTNFLQFESFDVELGRDGSLAFGAALTGPGVTSANRTGIWARSSPAATPTLVMRQGDQVPGQPAGTRFSLMDVLAAADGRYLVDAALTAGTSLAGFGVFRVDGAANVETLFRSGSQAASLPAGVLYGNPDLVNYNQNLDITFRTQLSGPGVNAGNDSAIFAPDGAGSYRLVTREGAGVPGLSNVSFLDFPFAGGELVLSDAGDVAFPAQFLGAGVNASNDTGLFYGDRNGGLVMVVREGQLLEVAPGVFKTVTGLSLNPTSARTTSINSLRELLFMATFSDGTSGVFLTTFVPEPGTALLLGLGIAGLAAGRRRRLR